MTTEMEDVPVVKLPGGDQWEDAYEAGRLYEAAFPDQDGEDFACAMAYAVVTPDELKGQTITVLKLLHQGRNDEDDWVWAVAYDDPNVTYRHRQWWVLKAGCDFTGWDCQSGGEWTRVGETR